MRNSTEPRTTSTRRTMAQGSRPTGMKSVTSATPVGLKNRVRRTAVSGR